MCDIKILKMIEDMRDIFLTGRSRDLNFRLKQLKNLQRLYEENWDRIREALQKDLNKPYAEAKVFEHAFLIGDVKIAIKSLKTWTKVHKLPTCLVNVSDNAWYRYEPFGTVTHIFKEKRFNLLLFFNDFFPNIICQYIM